MHVRTIVGRERKRDVDLRAVVPRMIGRGDRRRAAAGEARRQRADRGQHDEPSERRRPTCVAVERVASQLGRQILRALDRFHASASALDQFDVRPRNDDPLLPNRTPPRARGPWIPIRAPAVRAASADTLPIRPKYGIANDPHGRADFQSSCRSAPRRSTAALPGVLDGNRRFPDACTPARICVAPLTAAGAPARDASSRNVRSAMAMSPKPSVTISVSPICSEPVTATPRS